MLTEPGEDFRWLWDNDRADDATAAAVSAFQALVDRGDASHAEQWSDAPVRNPRNAHATNETNA